MTLLDQASTYTDQADLVILSHTETLRDQLEPVSASAIASLIGGAPVRAIAQRMIRLSELGCLETIPGAAGFYQLSELGCELLMTDLIGWTPSEREDRRREKDLLKRIAVRNS